MWSQSSKCMLSLWRVNVKADRCLNGLVVWFWPGKPEMGVQFRIEAQKFFGSLIVTNSIHCYISFCIMIFIALFMHSYTLLTSYLSLQIWECKVGIDNHNMPQLVTFANQSVTVVKTFGVLSLLLEDHWALMETTSVILLCWVHTDWM